MPSWTLSMRAPSIVRSPGQNSIPAPECAFDWAHVSLRGNCPTKVPPATHTLGGSWRSGSKKNLPPRSRTRGWRLLMLARKVAPRASMRRPGFRVFSPKVTRLAWVPVSTESGPAPPRQEVSPGRVVVVVEGTVLVVVVLLGSEADRPRPTSSYHTSASLPESSLVTKPSRRDTRTLVAPAGARASRAKPLQP